MGMLSSTLVSSGSGARLWAAVLVVALTAGACASATEFDTSGPETVAPIDQGSEVVLAPTVEPVVPSDAPAVVATSEGVASVDPDDPDEAIAEPDGEQVGAPDVNTGEPVTWLIPALQTVGDVTSMIYREPVEERGFGMVGDRDLAMRGFTPDGTGHWARLSTQIESCPEFSLGTRLAIFDVDTNEARPVDAGDDRFLDIARIHYGPGDQVLLEASCGKYSSPGALATMGADGSLSDLRSIDELGGGLWMWKPRWGYTEDGKLVVVVPMGGQRRTAIDNYVVVATGEVIEKVATDVLAALWLSDAHHVQIAARTDGGEGRQVLVNGEPVWAGVIVDWDHDRHSFVAVGPSGGVWVRTQRAWDEPLVEAIDIATTSVAIAPSGEAVAFSSPDGLEVHGTFGVEMLADLGGNHVAFSPDGAQLSYVVGAPGDPLQAVRTFVFDQAIADPGAIVPGTVVSSGGLGAIRVGMTISEVEQATGLRFTVESIGTLSAGECMWAQSDDLLGVSLIGEARSGNPGDAIVHAVTVRSSFYPTPSGVRIGDLTEKVLDLFPGQIESSPHVYSNGTYLDYLPSDEGETTSVRFETLPGGQIDVIHAGRIAWTQLVEGCA